MTPLWHIMTVRVDLGKGMAMKKGPRGLGNAKKIYIRRLGGVRR